MGAKKNTDPAEFWRDYEKRYGEKVLAFTLGRYISGWASYETPLWGLLIATGGGFRFHHFPHEGWIDAISRITTGGEAPQEKTIFIPKGWLVSVELRIEKSWWKKILSPHPPRLSVRYRTPEGVEAELLAETDQKAETLLAHLRE
ncbi:MAG: hypothetical protein LBP93_00225 [Treponema sp.]|jgi:hypothetical protein|nr:hypothetical protein [Treponema sp.]